jgi:hypothetical protein
MPLEERGQALEEQFFKKQEAEQLKALREKQNKAEAKEALAKASGMTDDAVLERLVELEISPETVSAVSLVPLVAVAWADGKMDDNERKAILMAAKGKGIEEDTPALELLESWLQSAPEDELLDAWEGYIGALDEHLNPEQKKVLRTQVVARARDVANAAGGFLGFKKIDAAEERVLARLEAAFDGSGDAAAPSDTEAAD